MESCKRAKGKPDAAICDIAALHCHNPVHPQIAALASELVSSRAPSEDKFDSVAVVGEFLRLNRLVRELRHEEE
jgi:hypothetical protein